jgi:anti-sigma-K factor RskA
VNVQEYISSGIIESYVLGLASPEERNEFEQMCIQYQEVLQARTDFEIALEKQAMENAFAPSAGLKKKIMEEIGSSGKVVSMSAVPVRKINWWKISAAACFALLAGSLYWISSLSGENKKLKQDYNETVTRLNNVEKDIQVITGRQSVKMAAMTGQPVSPASYSTVYWDTTSHDVYLLINNLPIPASDKQYQLWAFIDNKPVDIGLIGDSAFIRQGRLLVKAKNAQNVQAFAITLERKGRPDISKPEGAVYVMGKL